MLTTACGLFSDDDDAAATTTTAATTPTTAAAPVVTVAPSTADTTAAELGLSTDSKLSTQGLGPVFIGHSLADAQTAAGTEMVLASQLDGGCAIYVFGEEQLQGITIVTIDGEVHRIDIGAGPITTTSGYGIGSSGADIRAAFGDRIEDGPIVNAIQFVPVDEPDADKRVVWELDANGLVQRLWAGRLPAVNDAAPCFSFAS